MSTQCTSGRLAWLVAPVHHHNLMASADPCLSLKVTLRRSCSGTMFAWFIVSITFCTSAIPAAKAALVSKGPPWPMQTFIVTKFDKHVCEIYTKIWLVTPNYGNYPNFGGFSQTFGVNAKILGFYTLGTHFSWGCPNFVNLPKMCYLDGHDDVIHLEEYQEYMLAMSN